MAAFPGRPSSLWRAGGMTTSQPPARFFVRAPALRLTPPLISIAFSRRPCHAWRTPRGALAAASVTIVAPLSRSALPRTGEDTLWAVIATVGKVDRIAEVYRSRDAALEDRAWRAAQVKAYEHLIARTKHPVPRYSVAPIRRADIPRAWSPLPALGFLRGSFV